ncbi:MAG: hypothetical protein V4584_16570 [Verrucomicrobiota bacterium]
MARQPAISFSISFQHPFSRAGGRTSNVRPKKMRSFLTILVFSFSSLAVAEESPGKVDLPKTFSAIVDSTPSATFVRCLEHSDIVAVYSEREARWWGQLSVYQRRGDVIEWRYSYPDSYEEFRGHYVVRFRWIQLKQTEKPILEVIESTHMGNGSLRIWELDGRTLRLLLEATVRGRFSDPPAVFGVPQEGEASFAGGHLAVEYQRPSGQEFDSIHLRGSIQITDMEGKVLPSRRYEQVCRWDSTQRKFLAELPTSP